MSAVCIVLCLICPILIIYVAICDSLPLYPHYLQSVKPVIPVFVFLSVAWTAWDPTWGTRHLAKHERHKMCVIGKSGPKMSVTGKYEHLVCCVHLLL